MAVCNGEIYNHSEIRRELEPRGIIFRTCCDTEAIVALAEACSFDFVDRLEGIFAFALWDRREKRLLLARDGLGVKPLFYRVDTDGIRFASELSSLRALDDLSWTVNAQALHDYLGLNSIPSPASIWKEVGRVEPGEQFVWQAGKATGSFYWRATDCLGQKNSEHGGNPMSSKSPAALRALLKRVVSDQLMSDVPVGVFLSSGLDSAVVLDHAISSSKVPPRCFTLSMDGLGFDESTGAVETARLLGAPIEVLPFAVPNEQRLREMVRNYGEPFGDSSAVAVWELCRQTAGVVKVALSGDGGDEVFGGYETHRAHAIAEGAVARFLRPFARPVAQLLEMIPASDRKVPLRYKATRFLHHAHLPAPARHHRWKMINDVSAVRGLYTPDWLAANPGLGDPERLWWRVFAAAGPTAGPVSRAMLADLGVYLPNDLLVKVDIAGMAHGLEVRVPLLDRRLVEFMAPLPDASKASARRNKILLRASIDNPKLRAAVERPKKGFSVPVSAWLRGELGRLLMDSVRSARFRALGAIDAVGVEAMYRRHMRHEADLSRPLWGMLMLAVWWDGVGETS